MSMSLQQSQGSVTRGSLNLSEKGGVEALPAAAQEVSTIMCDNGIVNIGDMDVDVQDKCGQPKKEFQMLSTRWRRWLNFSSGALAGFSCRLA